MSSSKNNYHSEQTHTHEHSPQEKAFFCLFIITIMFLILPEKKSGGIIIPFCKNSRSAHTHRKLSRPVPVFRVFERMAVKVLESAFTNRLSISQSKIIHEWGVNSDSYGYCRQVVLST